MPCWFKYWYGMCRNKKIFSFLDNKSTVIQPISQKVIIYQNPTSYFVAFYDKWD